MRAWIASEAGSPDRENEDFAAVSGDVAVLLDGAGVPHEVQTGCLHGVAWFARTLGSEILAQATATDDLSAALAHAISAVARRHEGVCDLSHPMTPSTTVVLTKVSGSELRYLVLADSTLLLVGDTDINVITDSRFATSPTTNSVRRQPNLRRNLLVASADPTAACHAITGSASLTKLRHWLLLSDGASRTADRFLTHTWSELVQLCVRAGPAALIAETRRFEAIDALGTCWPRTKTHDDATILRLAQDRTRWNPAPSRPPTAPRYRAAHPMKNPG